MLKEKILKLLNAQVEKEFYSSNLYLAMASWAESEGLEGTSQWLYIQADEEKMHMLKFLKYINERGNRGIVPAIKQPPVKYKDIFTLFDEVLKHENMITDSINNIVGECIKEKDFSTYAWVQFFVNEQIEEEKSVRIVIDKLKLLGKDKNNLYQFDKDVLSLRQTAGNTTAGQN